jgi:hypothetical protein
VYGTFNKKGESIRAEADELHGEVVLAGNFKGHGNYLGTHVQKESYYSLSRGKKTF